LPPDLGICMPQLFFRLADVRTTVIKQEFRGSPDGNLRTNEALG